MFDTISECHGLFVLTGLQCYLIAIEDALSTVIMSQRRSCAIKTSLVALLWIGCSSLVTKLILVGS
jgi:hypothetical protein